MEGTIGEIRFVDDHFEFVGGAHIADGAGPQGFYWCLNPQAQASEDLYDALVQFMDELSNSPDDPVFLDIGAKQMSGGYGGHGGLGLTSVGGGIDLAGIRGGEELQGDVFEALTGGTADDLGIFVYEGHTVGADGEAFYVAMFDHM